MDPKIEKFISKYYSNFRIYHELMPIRFNEILLVSSPYDAFILEKDGDLAARIINEYSGLNLSKPPRITWTSSALEALSLIDKKRYDVVITMPHIDKMDALSLGGEIKKKRPKLPVILLSHGIKSIQSLLDRGECKEIDKVFVWLGNSELLLAIVKIAEDRLNVDIDTQKAMTRVLLLVEDSPVYYSSFLPIIYKEIVIQTQAVLGGGLTEEHRLLRMRARPKILLASNYEEAVGLYQKYSEFIFGVISDTRFPKNGKINGNAGVDLLTKINKETPDIPLLLMSSESENREKANKIPAVFLDKNSPAIIEDLHDFFLEHLGFGDFVFRMPDGSEIGRASNLRTLEAKISEIPDESLYYHAEHNHFSNWIMGRSEVILASTLRDVKPSEFKKPGEMKKFIISLIHTLRKWRQKGIVTRFREDNFDAKVFDFVKIGRGSLGGKARGLAFMSKFLQQHSKIYGKYPKINIKIPNTLVISTDGFESFVTENRLQFLGKGDFADNEIAEKFLKVSLPAWLVKQINVFLAQVKNPLSVRSSSLLEDARFQPYAGLYKTCLLANNHPALSVRLEQLLTAIKLVYASTYFEAPRSFAKSVSSTPREEAMAVIIQQLAGSEYNGFFYPAVSGVALSHNFYPVAHMKSEEGIVHTALGLGKTVVEGERTLRFSPKYPDIIPQFSSVDDILKNSQRYFYALKIDDFPAKPDLMRLPNLIRREVDDAQDEFPVKILSSTYIPEDHRIRDTGFMQGPKIITFAQILKHNILPLPDLLNDLLEIGKDGLGCPVEIEFAVDLTPDKKKKDNFFFLQIRPLSTHEGNHAVNIVRQDIEKAFCYSAKTLGNGADNDIADIIYVKLDDFKPEATLQIAGEIGYINAELVKKKRPYLLVGPGRWGSADKWLGIPVKWQNISGVEAMVELNHEKLKADPSQGSHFFQNITSLGIFYFTVRENSEDYFNFDLLNSIEAVNETEFIRHVRLDKPLNIKIDGRRSIGVIIAN